jgi:hypothetical protein
MGSQELFSIILVSHPKGKQGMSTDLDQPVQGKGVLTARSFTYGNGFGSRYLNHSRTCPENGISYYIVYLNHTYNIAGKT